MPITLQKVNKRPANNTVYGLEYRPLMIRKETFHRLKELKELSGLPLTELAQRAIEYYVEHVEVRDAGLSQR